MQARSSEFCRSEIFLRIFCRSFFLVGPGFSTFQAPFGLCLPHVAFVCNLKIFSLPCSFHIEVRKLLSFDFSALPPRGQLFSSVFRSPILSTRRGLLLTLRQTKPPLNNASKTNSTKSRLSPLRSPLELRSPSNPQSRHLVARLVLPLALQIARPAHLASPATLLQPSWDLLGRTLLQHPVS